MNRYDPSTPRTALGLIALALTVVNFGLSVVAPAALVAQGETRATAGQTVTANTAMKRQG